MEDEQDDGGVPPAARRFLERHRPAREGRLGSAGRDTDGDNDNDDDDNEAGDQQEAEGELEIEGPGVGDGLDFVVDADPGVPAPPPQHLVCRPKAKGVKHPPVATTAQVEKHALEQHVNCAPWCLHCLQASALMKTHPL